MGIYKGNLMSKMVLYLVVLITPLMIMISSVFAQTPEITNGLNYLTSTQNPDGSWGGTDTSINTDFYSTALSVETLKVLEETNTQTHINGVQWLNDYPVENSGYIAWKILALSEENIDLTPDINLLLQWQNEDWGWGGYNEYVSSNFYTGLALQAINAINYPDQDTINYALSYLISTQNDDGGWAFSPDSDSNVYMTALVSMTLQQFSLTADLATAINNATDYLINQQQVDGRWGSIYETALAYIALVGEITDATVLGNAVNYLTETQLPNGSWNDDPYSTALALRALYLSENKPPPPPQPTTGTVTGKVVDASMNQPLEEVSVVSGQLSATTTNTGEFTFSDMPSGSQTITFSLENYRSSTSIIFSQQPNSSWNDNPCSTGGHG